MNNIFSVVLVIIALIWSASTAADIVVIVNPSSGIDTLTKEDVSKIFLGKKNTFPNGKPATAISLDKSLPLRIDFDGKLLNKTQSQMNAYWGQLVFTGRGTPPREYPDEAAVKKEVATNPQTIGFVSSDQVDNSVKPVLTVK